MDDSEYKAWALIGFSLTATLMNQLKQSGVLSLQQEADIYDEVLLQLEHVQATSGGQADAVQRARAIISTLLGGPRRPPKGKTGPT